MIPPLFNDAPTRKESFKPLRARLSPQQHAYFNEAGKLSAADTRARQKKYLLYVIGARLRPGVVGNRAQLHIRDLRLLMHNHRDCRTATGSEARRKWVERSIKLLVALPFVTQLGSYIQLDYFYDDHGSADYIDAHHAEAARQNRRNKAAYQARERTRVSGMSAASAKLCISQPAVQIVESEPYFPLTLKSGGLYNASTPPNRVPTQPQQAAGFVASPPRRASAVSANRAVAPRPTPTLVSFRSRSDKTLASPSIPQPPPYTERPDFDPRTHAKARRVYAHGPLDAAYVSMMVDVHPGLENLSFDALRANGATNDSVYKACHLYVNNAHKVTNPVGWVLSTDRRLRQGKLRYA